MLRPGIISYYESNLFNVNNCMFEDIYIDVRIPVNDDAKSLHCSEHIKKTRTRRRV